MGSSGFHNFWIGPHFVDQSDHQQNHHLEVSLTLNKSKACSVEGITSSCNTLGGLTYVRETVMAAVGGAGLTPRNSHESVTINMVINAQLARSIDEDLLCVFHQYLVKEA